VGTPDSTYVSAVDVNVRIDDEPVLVGVIVLVGGTVFVGVSVCVAVDVPVGVLVGVFVEVTPLIELKETTTSSKAIS